ncbi:hypothetical protein H0485_02685 [Pseudogemmobacter sp. CC-YST710]|uniref:Uncharacterized protein n=2 Tax=Pseudogemmobacter faecipullorum TaxID=2755041 RepID=A0ABS8CHQ6_9RHOB|nr:hypothetical protein [Pseudogemmobacter faecipullorum]
MAGPSEPEEGKALFPAAGGRSRNRMTEIAAGLVSGIWIVAVLSYFFTASPGEDSGSLSLVLTLLVLFLPLVLIWVAAITLRSLGELRAEAQRLQASVEAMRNSYLRAQHAQSATLPAAGERRPAGDNAAAAPPEAGTAQPGFASRRDTALSQPSADRKAALAAPKPEPEAEQPGLALGTPAESLRPPLSVTDFIQALQFPESPEDKAGFRALRLALEDREVAKLIRSAQDVLTLLSQEGIYMDDLRPELCHPDFWRRFAAGERGRGVTVVGGIRDRSSLALTAARMREDTIFRDAAHHFLRTFDKVFQAFEKNASDAELAALADTRTARAFMVVSRVAGVFE